MLVPKCIYPKSIFGLILGFFGSESGRPGRPGRPMRDKLIFYRMNRDQGDLVWSDLAQNFSDFVAGSHGTVS